MPRQAQRRASLPRSFFRWHPHPQTTTPPNNSQPPGLVLNSKLLPDPANWNSPHLLKQLWEEAYEKVHQSDRSLVDAYEDILSREAAESKAHSVADDSEHGFDKTKVEVVQNLIEKGLEKTEKLAKAKQVGADVLAVIDRAKNAITAFAEASPPAAFAWAGICLALQVKKKKKNPPSLSSNSHGADRIYRC